MYSDVIESPSNDCFSFNDQPLSYDMAEMNEISNQNNLDYIFDSYYSSVSKYNTGFEFPEDCKNMSFSELFDQELFSSQENKDCKITIKIEKEDESLQPCYSTINTQDTTDSHPLIQIEENVPPSSLAKRFAPKRGINRTFIKTTNNCDVQRLIYNPFCETEDLSIDQPLAEIKLPIVKCEPEDVSDTVEQNIVGGEIKPFYSDNSQNTANGLSFVNIEDNSFSSLSKSSTTKRRGINRTIIKKNRKSDIQQLMYNPFYETEDVIIDQPPAKIILPILKHEREDVSDTVEQNIVGREIKPFYCDDSQNIANGLSFVKVEDVCLPSSSKSSTMKRQGINRTFIKKNQKSDIQQLMYTPFCETEDVIIDQSLMKFQIPVIKQEPDDVNGTEDLNVVAMEIKPFYSDNSQNITSKGLVMNKENCSTLSRNSTAKHQPITNTSEYCNIDHLVRCKTSTSLGIGQTSAIVNMAVLKCEPEEVSATVDQNIVKVKVEPYSDNLQNATNSHSFVNIEDSILSSSSNNLVAPEHKIISGTFIEKIKNCDVNQLIYGPSCETQSTGIDQMSVKVEFPIVKCEPESVDNTIEQNIVEMDIETEDESLNEFGCIKLNNTIVENEEITIVKKEDKSSNGIPFKNDSVYSQTFKTNNLMTSETEKKKISWEEYRAKREKLGHTNILENKKKVGAIAFDEMDNEKMEDVIKEFDRNTAEYFASEKRKIENNGKQNINAKRVSSVDDQELEKKRMKIEYIKKLLPSSFASEIAKTSSLMKGNLVEEEFENESTSDDSIMSSDKMHAKQTETYGDLVYEKSQKKGHLSRIHSSRRNSRSDYNSNKSSRSSSTSSSNHDDYYNRNRVDAMQHGGQYGQNVRNNTTVPRSKEQKTVVYVGQIPIRFGKRYLYNRFKEFGKIQSLTLHKKPDFRVYYAFVTYSERSEAERAISHGNHDQTQAQFDIRFGERKQTQTPYYDLDDEWLTDWYGYNNQHSTVVRKPQSSERKVSFEEELKEFYKLTQIQKLNQIKSSQVS